MISSPGFTSRAFKAMSIATLPLQTDAPNRQSCDLANSFSSFFTLSPVYFHQSPLEYISVNACFIFLDCGGQVCFDCFLTIFYSCLLLLKLLTGAQRKIFTCLWLLSPIAWPKQWRLSSLWDQLCLSPRYPVRCRNRERCEV